MPRSTQPLRDEHRDLSPHVAQLRAAADVVGIDSEADTLRAVDDALDFLTRHLLPHARAEDAALYPVVARAMGAPEATATMRRDHVEVERLTTELGQVRERLATGEDDDAVQRDLRRVLYGLYAVVGLHFAKEEEVYLPLLDERLGEEEARGMFRAMETAAGEAASRA